jgi:hypothetical protein
VLSRRPGGRRAIGAQAAERALASKRPGSGLAADSADRGTSGLHSALAAAREVRTSRGAGLAGRGPCGGRGRRASDPCARPSCRADIVRACVPVLRSGTDDISTAGRLVVSVHRARQHHGADSGRHDAGARCRDTGARHLEARGRHRWPRRSRSQRAALDQAPLKARVLARGADQVPPYILITSLRSAS